MYVVIAIGYALAVAVYAIYLNVKWRKADKSRELTTISMPAEKARNQ